MSQQVICDECGMPIDQTLPYYAATVTPMQTLDGQLVAGESVKRDWHTEHVPHSQSGQGSIIGDIEIPPDGGSGVAGEA
jgi:hypothetical protein